MRFKIYFNEKTKSLDVNCLEDKSLDKIIPENPDQHISYPIPIESRKEIKKYLTDILNSELSKEFIDLENDINVLNTIKREKMHELRKVLNVEIFKKCEDFKEDFPEYFI